MDEFFARNRLSAYLDGELDTAEAREVEDALARSAELRAELDQLRAGIALLRSGGPVPAPKGFARRLDARLAEEPMRVGWTRHLRRVRAEAVLLAAAAALVLVFAGKKPAEPAPDVPEAADEARTDGAVAEDAVADAADATPGEEAPAADAADATKDDATGGAPTPAAPAVDVAGMPGVADGVLGDEKAEQKKSVKQKTAPKATKSAMSKLAVEKEAYVPAWEQQATSTAPPTVQAPARYRLQLTSETGLRDLDALVRQYGGRLEDERGKPLAPYPMEAGETRKVRLNIPAGTISAGQLYDRLRALGHAELTQTDTLYAGSSAPVVIEVSRE